ncbi:NAD(P)H-dependent oxidoreductase subunit E [Cellulomonas sp. KRMCY2]|uniref:NADH-quinone oxidoreductase subunit NuoE family protein n=1 Tax=Cellulomonas sp. KRMCY2 TaxID=1304865 RepID=UPI00045EA3AA|nr:NAD(P)H-dependent oxidoreductase subunit E [Cellulomonas sp. KRMCY2]
MLTLPVELAAEHADLIAAIDALVDAHGATRSALIPVLQGLREQRHEINDVAMQVVADRLGITPVDVQGVVTFYSFLKMEAAGKHIVHVCRTLSCEMAGMRRVAEQLQAELGVTVGGTSADNLVTLDWVNCIGMCDQPPALLIDRKALGRVTPAQVREIVAGLRAEAATT